MYHLLSLLESDAAGVVATQRHRAELAELAAPARGAGSRRPARRRSTATLSSRVNERFHMRLLEIADNRWRDQMVADLRKVMKLNRHNSLLKTGRIGESLKEHRAIMAAIKGRDAGVAMARMREHFRNGLEAAN